MRYLEGQEANPDYPHGENMHQMLTFSMLLSLVFGAILLYAGIRGKIIWLTVWSALLMLCSIIYLAGDGLGFW
jgi:hypothetical protein